MNDTTPELHIHVASTSAGLGVYPAALARILDAVGIPHAIHVASAGGPGDALLEDLALPGADGVAVFLVRVDDWAKGATEDDRDRAVSERVARLVATLDRAAPDAPLAIVAFVQPGTAGSPAAIDLDGHRRRVTLAANAIGERADIVALADPGRATSSADVGAASSAADIGADVALADLAARTARRIFARRAFHARAVVVDADRTLWPGSCGEEGPPEWSELEPPFVAIQRFLAAMRGAPLALCSRNEESDILDVFRAHPEMPLSLAHLRSWRIGWSRASASLASLADELAVPLSTVVYVTRNAAERDDVRAAHPEVATILLPDDMSNVERLLASHWLLPEPPLRTV